MVIPPLTLTEQLYLSGFALIDYARREALRAERLRMYYEQLTK